jgi:hypothetical protein
MGGWSERVMGQKGFFDVKIVPWEDFRTDIEAVTETKPEERKSNAGRKPYDTILKFKIMVLQSLHNLSDDRTEYLIRDRISFMRFLDLKLEDPVPDATIWLFREALAQAGLIDKLFERFGRHLEAEGYIARGGQIIDATIVSVPKQRNTREENETIKAGKTRRLHPVLPARALAELQGAANSVQREPRDRGRVPGRDRAARERRGCRQRLLLPEPHDESRRGGFHGLAGVAGLRSRNRPAGAPAGVCDEPRGSRVLRRHPTAQR